MIHAADFSTGPVRPDAGMIATYVEVVFGYCEGLVPVRGLAEKGTPDQPAHTPFLPADHDLGAKLLIQATWAAQAGMALFVVPGTVASPEARAEDVAQTQVVLVDLDAGDIALKREHLVRYLGEPSLEVVSGGVTEAGQNKVHLYWKLSEPAEGPDLATVCRLRHALAVKVGADPSFRSAHQPIRVAGSVHAKNGVQRLVSILASRSVEYELADLAEAVMALPPLAGEARPDLDFNDADPAKPSVEDLFQTRIRAGGVDGTTRFDALSSVIGYWIRRCRSGLVSRDEAWAEIVGYNEARIDPPWPQGRLAQEVDRLWKRDQDQHAGPSSVQASADRPEDTPEPATTPFTEDALAREFTRRYAEDWRYVALWAQWLTWTGTRWQHETTLQAYDLARRICREAAQLAMSDKIAAKLASASTVAAVERLARADRRHAASCDEWDRDPWLLNAPAGVVDLRTGDLRPHHRADRMTRLAGASPQGGCPTWLNFLGTVTHQDAELQAYLKRVVGYLLTGLTREHALFFLYGTGANGKSVFCNVLAAMLGDYATSAPMDMFMASVGERHPTDLASLRGSRLVTAVETEQGSRWAESRLKTLTGGDPVKARFMRQDFFEFTPQFKLVIAGNHKPAVRNIGEAMRRRFHLVPFTVTIPSGQRDRRLTERLLAERDGILAWAVEGCLEWQATGLKPPRAVLAATEEYFEEEDAVGRWIGEECVTGPAHTALIASLYSSWKAWAEAAGEYVGSLRRLSEKLADRGFERWRDTDGDRRGFQGIALKNNGSGGKFNF